MPHAPIRRRPGAPPASPRRSGRGRALSLGLGLGALASGCGAPTVVRVIDGAPVEGRYISPEAYAYYARGAEAEARGQYPEAVALYARAAEEDEEGAEAWTRLGAARCAHGAALARAGRPAEAARARASGREAFEKAEAQDASFGPLWRERARCAADPASALAASSRAVALDPEREEAVLVHAAALRRAGRDAEARAWLEELAARPRISARALRAVASAARALSDGPLARQAASRLADGTSPGVSPTHAPRRARLADVDAALAAGNLRAARRRALEARLPPGELAARAAALGRPLLARDQAELVLGAEPGNVSARLALAAALDLLGETEALAAELAELSASRSVSTPPSRLARLLFARVVERHAGREAARLALGDVRLDREGPDPLENELARRLRGAASLP